MCKQVDHMGELLTETIGLGSLTPSSVTTSRTLFFFLTARKYLLLSLQSKVILKPTNIVAYDTYAEVLPFPVCRFKKLRFIGEIPCPHHLSDLKSGLESDTDS